MKRISTALLLGGLAALSACGGGSQANKASNVTANDVYVVPDDLGNDVLLNDVLLNDVGLNAAAPGNAAAGNAASSNTLGNSR